MHIGFIMDGNGRWALQNGLTRAESRYSKIFLGTECMAYIQVEGVGRGSFYRGL
jgi:undecaprenyl pyrophosphate synthase